MRRKASDRASEVTIKDGDYNMVYFWYGVNTDSASASKYSLFDTMKGKNDKKLDYTSQSGKYEVYWYFTDSASALTAAAGVAALLGFAF